MLLVEDEPPLRQLTRRILESVGYRVLEAGNGEDALRKLEENRSQVDLVITDVVMPGMSGRELASRITEARPSTKVLYVSGYTDDAILRHGVRGDTARFRPSRTRPSSSGGGSARFSTPSRRPHDPPAPRAA
ncbi:MAG: response regulator [Vicinamibacterales bacterium]